MSLAEKQSSLTMAALPFTQYIRSQVSPTVSKVQQVLSWSDGKDAKPFQLPQSIRSTSLKTVLRLHSRSSGLARCAL